MQSNNKTLAWVLAAAFLAVAAWDASGLDLALARAMGGAGGFPLRDDWFLESVMHGGARHASWLLETLFCALAVWPLGVFARLPMGRRLQVAATAILSSGLVGLLKANSLTSCPWDLHEFGGVARHLSHWAGWFQADGGGGGCFPAGHASTGFAFLGGYFALRHHAPRAARVGLAVALVAGLVLGLGQQLRGAHFMSHTLWTGWVCWMAAWLVDPLFAGDPAPTATQVAR